MRLGFRLIGPLIGVTLLAAAATAADAFVSGFEDVPLMPGLAMVEGSAVVFDKPDGRIVEAIARGRVKPQEARGFYRAALPELGWRPVEAEGSKRVLEFRRERETLQIELRPGPNGLDIRYFLAPR